MVISMLGRPTITGVILAGGQASRMGGEDKGLVHLNHRPLIEHVIAVLEPQVDRLLINSNRNLARYRGFGYPVISDRLPDYAGPLAGILAALEYPDTEFLLCVPCDGPWLPADLIERLLSVMLEKDAEISCVHDGERLHPVFALLRGDLREPLAEYLDMGGRAVYRWFQHRRLAQVDFSDCAELFTNINTTEELQRIESMLSSATSVRPTTE
ncbi:MAG: molybdenum cofactor guanylyltransferase MobA [Gammaproteobacteria bacterium]|nr:molybdenum cofactor guanylyltransferase MobA [Gammaproteobacteria bacterium]